MDFLLANEMRICLELLENKAEKVFQIKTKQNKTKRPKLYWKFKVGTLGKKSFFHTGLNDKSMCFYQRLPSFPY